MMTNAPHVLGLAGLAALLTLTGCHRSENPAPAPTLPAAAVRAQAVPSRTIMASEEVVGTVRARVRASIEAKVSGRIETLTVEAGQSVKAGDLIAQLDVREIQAQFNQARLAYDLAERERERVEALFKQNIASQQAFDSALTQARITSEMVKQAETMLGYARVAAPFDGIVTRKLAEVGDLASPGRALIELEDPATLRMEADIPEALIGCIQAGARLPLRGSAAGPSLEGAVSEIAPAADPNSRTFRVKLDLPAGHGLRLGQFGRVSVPVREVPVLSVPAAAVVQRGQMEMVFVVAGQTAQMRLVKTGKRLGPDLEIVSGLNAGEVIVTEGAATLRDGQPLNLQGAKQP